MSDAPIQSVRAAAFTVPTERSESDGTLDWDSVSLWFEQPVSSDDLGGLRLMRDAGPPDTDIAAGGAERYRV